MDFRTLQEKKIEGRILKRQAKPIAVGGIEKVSFGNVFLIGKAAAVVNPFDLAGIVPSIEMAKRLAEAIVKGNLNYFGRYWERYRKILCVFEKGIQGI